MSTFFIFLFTATATTEIYTLSLHDALPISALEAYRAGAIRLVPERWGATYEHWMENIRDWNISRQLWWGHRIPVFTCTQCAPRRQWADREDPKTCPTCGGPVEQDPDVLDTWFSSWLWPFAPFGWPDRTPDLARFYPGHTLVTGADILDRKSTRLNS